MKRRNDRKASCVEILIVMALVVVVWEIQTAKADMSASQCEEEKRLLVDKCRPVAFGFNPSAACCQIVRTMHVGCVCPAVTPRLAAFIGVERAIKKIEGCGRPVPHHFKCGAITTP